MRLHHLHIPRPIPYAHSLRLQEALVQRHFANKDALRKDGSLKDQAPAPTLLTFQTHPTYTVGRRHLTSNPLSQSQISFLTGLSNYDIPPPPTELKNELSLANFFPSPRGGLLTYHAPGQLTAYLILNLRTHGLTPRCYIRLLENTVMRTCARHGVANVTTTEDPGVWITEEEPEESSSAVQKHEEDTCGIAIDKGHAVSGHKATDRKICAIGVHVSRGITSHGIGLNVLDSSIDTIGSKSYLYTLPQDNIYIRKAKEPLQHATSNLDEPDDGIAAAQEPEDSQILAPGYLSWGFSRVVACGLEGKSVTWLSREQKSSSQSETDVQNNITQASSAASSSLTLEAVAESLASEVAQSLKIDEPIQRVEEDDIFAALPRDFAYLTTLSGDDFQPPDDDSNNFRLRHLFKDQLLRF